MVDRHAQPTSEAEAFEQRRITTRSSADVTQPDDRWPNCRRPKRVLFAVGFDRAAGGSIDEVYAGGVQNVLAALPSDVGRVIYISTTGVYGNAGGEWVDEDTPPDPQRDGGRASLAAEQVLAASPFASRGVVLRLAGIYGPGRIPFLGQAAGRRADSGGERGLSQSDSRRRCGGGGRRRRPNRAGNWLS